MLLRALGVECAVFEDVRWDATAARIGVRDAGRGMDLETRRSRSSGGARPSASGLAPNCEK